MQGYREIFPSWSTDWPRGLLIGEEMEGVEDGASDPVSEVLPRGWPGGEKMKGRGDGRDPT